MAIEVGDKVTLKPSDFSALGIDRKRAGGKAVILTITEGPKGTVYRVMLMRNDRIRSVRRDGFSVCRKPKDEKGKTKKGKQAKR